jgi:hypothetical protein
MRKAFVLSAFAAVMAATAGAKEQAMVDFGKVDITAAKVEKLKTEVRGPALRLHDGEAGSVELAAPVGGWNVGECHGLELDVRNTGKTAAKITLLARSAGGQGANSGWAIVAPGAAATVKLPFVRLVGGHEKVKMFAMRGIPPHLDPKRTVEPARLSAVTVRAVGLGGRVDVDLLALRATGELAAADRLTAESFLPFIDEFGQYAHGDWPGKVHGAADLAKRKADEAADLAAHAGPKDWDRYGGWAAGPELEATGFFRTEKRDGKWWLVDPEGRLFFSHGIDCVRMWEGTPLDGREAWFARLPAREGEFAPCYGRQGHVAHMEYVGKQPETFEFGRANLIRKYGKEYEATFTELSHRRLRSWGLNTIGTWSAADVYLARRTPYTAIVNTRGVPIAGSKGYWGKFPDVFAPTFGEGLDKRLAAEAGKSAGDAWCLGFFVDNELAWGKEGELAEATVASPADQPAKQALLTDLKGKYGSVEKLNAAWATAHASWQAVAAATAVPKAKAAREDLAAFDGRLIEEYFRVCRAAVKRAAPKQLYLGCRFAWSNPRVVAVAAKHCDVLSFNIYKTSPVPLDLPAGVDRPVIIGEYHFGALDRGMFHTGLVAAADQHERGEMYKAYVRDALRNANVVGCHWFLYRDQPTTGRALDGENYQIGLVDICDTPQAEMVSAAREAAAGMYGASQ